MRWGLIPFWAKGEPPKYSTINARSETVEKSPSYRGPWSRGQRCILPVIGFYEWQKQPGAKQPYFIRMSGGEPFGLLRLWDTSTKPGREAVGSCTIITVPANPMVKTIHNRMPALVTAETAGAWLEGSQEEAKALLRPFRFDVMDAYPISTRVNSPRNQGAGLIQPHTPG